MNRRTWIVASVMTALMTGGFGAGTGPLAIAQDALLSPDDALAGTMKRADIPEKYRWNLTDLYADVAAWEAAFKEIEADIAKLAEAKGTLGKSPAALLKFLQFRDQCLARLNKLALYAGTSYHLDMSVSETGGRFERVEMLNTRTNEATSWFTPEVIGIPQDKIFGWMDENADLAIYRHEFDDIYRRRKHILSAREEELLAMASGMAGSFSTIFNRLHNTNLDFPKMKDADGNEIQISSATYYDLIYSPDRRVRKDVFLGLHNVYHDKRNTISAILSGEVKQHMFYAKARGFKSSLESTLYEPGIPPEVVENLIATVNKHLPKVRRYVAIRKKVMGLDEIHRYDLRVPMLNAPETKIPYDDAVKTILAAVEPLGEEYVDTAKMAFNSRWLDVYETPNKRSGAYSWGVPLAPHPFMLLNYHGTRDNQSTVAHELGHTMHSWFSNRNQPLVYAHYVTFCAEVASTVNEVLLSEYLMNNAKDDMERLLILEEQIEGIRTAVIRQTMFTEFEKTIHEQVEAGQPLTGDGLCKTYGDIVQKYYGPDLVLDECAKAEGMRISQLYRDFYIFTYATSHCAATSIGKRIIEGEPGAVEGHLKFLSAGSSDYPLNILKLAGVDMTTPKPIEDTMELLDKLLDQFEKLYAKQKA